MATGPTGRGRPVFNVGQRRRAEHNVGHPLRAETLLDAELISRYGVPPSQHRCTALGCPVARFRQPALGGGHPCTAANRKSEQSAVTIRVSRRERHRNQRPAPTSSRMPALARPGSEGAGRLGAQRRCAGHLRGTHPADTAGDRRCRRNRRGGSSVPTEEMIAPQPHTGGLSALNPKPGRALGRQSANIRARAPALSARERQGTCQRAGVTKCLPGWSG